jgi:RNA polymerase sigma factor (sigma-70 family)
VSDSTSDEILMAAYQAGNQAAFAELFERHSGSVYGFLARRLPEENLAEDLYQEAFLRLHRARHSYDTRRPFRAWLFAIVHNLLNDVLREHARAPQKETLREVAASSFDDEAIAIADVSGQEFVRDDSSPEALACARQSTKALAAALRALPGDEATVLILARLEGLSYDDIGLVIGRSAAATKQLAYRALKRVRAEMVAAGHGEEL